MAEELTPIPATDDRQVREHKALSTDQVVAALRRFRARARGVAPVAGGPKR